MSKAENNEPKISEDSMETQQPGGTSAADTELSGDEKNNGGAGLKPQADGAEEAGSDGKQGAGEETAAADGETGAGEDAGAADTSGEKAGDEQKDAADGEPSRTGEGGQEEAGEEKKVGRKIYIIEGVLAVLAIGLLAFAIYRSEVSKRSTDDTVSEDYADSEEESTEIDNSILYTDLPDCPDALSFNTLTESDCEQAVTDGTMLKLAASGDRTLYVNNFEDLDYLISLVSYTAEELDESIYENLLVDYAEEVDPDHDTVQNGDNVDIDYIGTIDGVAFDGGTATAQQLEIGSGTYIDGFEDGLIGMKAGETRDLSLTFPEDYYSSDLAGKDVVFTVSLNEIVSTVVYPEELTLDIVQDAYPDYSSVEECREYFAKTLLQENIWYFLAEEFYLSDLDEDIVTDYYEQTMDYYDTISSLYQASVEDLISSSGETIDEFKSEVMDSAAEQSRYSLLYAAVMEQMGISLSDDDYLDLATEYGYEDTESFVETYGQQSIDDYLFQIKILETLADQIMENGGAEVSEDTDTASQADSEEDAEASETTDADEEEDAAE